MDEYEHLKKVPEALAKKCDCGFIYSFKAKQCPNCGNERGWQLLMYHTPQVEEARWQDG